MKKIIGGFSTEFCIILGTILGTSIGLAISQGSLHAKVDELQEEVEYFEEQKGVFLNNKQYTARLNRCW